MNAGIFGFPVGSAARYRVQEFDTSGTFYPSVGCQFLFVEMIGGGAGGQNGTAPSTNGSGGAAALYWSFIIPASDVGRYLTVTIGAGGASNNGTGGNTLVTNEYGVIQQEVGGGTGTVNALTITGAITFGLFGAGSGGTAGVGGNVGGIGAGGGGAGNSSSAAGRAGGAACRATWTSNTVDRGGGAAGATNARIRGRGLGEGAGGGGNTGTSEGGKGIRGSGGGGGAAQVGVSGPGGTGGAGFVRIIEVIAL